ncbi:MAG: zinc ribbon domain-containing protein [Oscillospiraceae bacterium]|nr:zinc ribbon domain-containing protein [Oscillospiraceae bacterium]
MAFCGNCGTQYEDGVKFCPSCGAPATGAAAPEQSSPAAPTVAPAAYQAPAATAVMDAAAKDAQENKAMAILAYIIFLIPLFAAKDSKFARYHTNQGLLVVLLSVAYGIVYTILSSVLFAISWRVGLAVTGILGLVAWVFPVLSIIGIVNVCGGKMKPLPIIGGITILK